MDFSVILLYILAAILLIICVGLFSVSNNRRAKWLAVATIAPLFWTLFIGLFLSSDNEYFSKFFVVAYYVSAAITPLGLIFFSVVHANKRLPIFLSILLPILTIGVCWMLISPDVMIKAIDVDSHVVQLSVVPYVVYLVYFVVFYLISTGILFHAYITSLSNRRKKKGISFGLFFICWVVGGTVGATFNLFLPLLGNYDLIWVGPLGLFMLIPVAFRITTTDEYYSAIKTFMRGLLYSLFAGSSVFVVFFITQIASEDLEFASRPELEQLIIIALALLFLIPIIFVLFLMTRKAVKDLDSDGYDEAEILRSMSQIASEKHGLTDFFRTVRHTLDKALGVEFVDILVFGQETAVHVDDSNLEGTLLRITTDRNKYGTIYREDVRSKNDYAALKAYNIEVVTPIVGAMDGKIVGVIVLSPRKRRFDRNYGETLVKVSAVLSPFIQSAVFYEQINSFNTKLKHQVREKTQELRESNKELMKLDELKDDLLSIASHNLRTPLTGIVGYVDMLREGDFGKMKPEQVAVLDEVVKSGKHMSQILTDFLDVTRINSGRLTLKKEKVDLAGLVAEEINNLKEMAIQHGRELVFNGESKKIEIIGDELHLRQVVVNLIDNAIYYGKNKIEIGLKKEGERTIFTVKDDGIGVSKEDQHKLFTKMFRASNAKSVRPDGSGIGLYVIKNIVEGSGGKVIFESTEGKGSVFGFEL